MVKVALVVGHKPSSPGACNESYGLCEFGFYNPLVDKVAEELDGDIEAVKILRDTYKDLPDKINAEEPDLIVSFHANSFEEPPGVDEVGGTEVLYYHKSAKGKAAATIMQEQLVDFLGTKDRGIVPTRSEDKGGYLLRYTHAPAILIEPFFIDNDEDLEAVLENEEEFAAAIARAIEDIVDQVIAG